MLTNQENKSEEYKQKDGMPSCQHCGRFIDERQIVFIGGKLVCIHCEDKFEDEEL